MSAHVCSSTPDKVHGEPCWECLVWDLSSVLSFTSFSLWKVLSNVFLWKKEESDAFESAGAFWGVPCGMFPQEDKAKTSFSTALSSASLFFFSAAFWKRAWIPPGFLGLVSVFEAASFGFRCDWVDAMPLLRKLVISPDEFSLNLLADKWRQVRGGDLEDKEHQ